MKVLTRTLSVNFSALVMGAIICQSGPFVATSAVGATPLQIAQQAYVKASNPGEGDLLGTSVAISGNTMVVGAPGEGSNAVGVNGSQNNDSSPGSGAAYVFVRSGTNWQQQAYLKASNTGAGDNFGYSVAISGDTIVIGAPNESSSATGVNGNQANNDAPYAGAAYVFFRGGTNWVQQAYLKASNTGSADYFGTVVVVSGDTVVIGAPQERSNASGVDGNQDDDSAFAAGAGYVFVRTGSNWSQQAYLKASNTGEGDLFGASMSLEGDTLVVGAYQEASNAIGVNGSQNNNNAPYAGAAYVFVRSGTNWRQQAYLKASNTGAGDSFGVSVALSGDTVVVGASDEDSSASGVNGNQNNNNAFAAGAAYVFVRHGTNWTHQAYLKASNPGGGIENVSFGDSFGFSAAISGDLIVVGAIAEDSNATGVNGNQGNNSATNSGAAYLFLRSGTNWSQQAYLKASNPGGEDWFGQSVAVSGDTLLVGAPYESSSAAGINGDQTSNDALASGAAYIFAGFGPPELRLTALRVGDSVHLTATGTTNTQWRLESRDAAGGTNAWQSFTNITLGVSPTVIQQPVDTTNRFYRGVWLP